jgi:hypothetical protein
MSSFCVKIVHVRGAVKYRFKLMLSILGKCFEEHQTASSKAEG